VIKMRALRASLFAASTLIAAQVFGQQLPPQQLRGAVVASTNSKAVSKIVELMQAGAGFEQIQETLPPEKFWVRKWGATQFVIIDRQMAQIQRIELDLKLAEKLLKNANQSLVWRIGELPKEDRDVVVSFLESFQPPEYRPAGFDINNGAIGLAFTYSFDIQGQGGSTNYVMGFSDKHSAKRDELLAKNPIPSAVPSADLAAKVDAERAAKALDSKLTLNFLGTANREIPKATEALSKELEKLFAEMEEQAAKAARELAKKLLPDGSALPAGPMSLNDLPKEMRDRLIDQFASAFSANGFESREAAEGFLLNSQSLQVRMGIGLRRMIKVGDPSQRIPGVAGSYKFIGFAGGIAP
jgi:hypothetical protein